MAVAKHIKMSALGRLDGTPERFSYSINFHLDFAQNSVNFSGANDSPLHTRVLGWSEDVRAFHGRATSYIHAKAVLESVKWAVIVEDSNGKPKYERNTDQSYNAIEIDVADTPGGGGNMGYVLPQAALAVSLQTPRPGGTGRGRFYLPMPVVPLADDLRINPVYVNEVKNSVVQLFKNLSNEPGPDFGDISGILEPIVASSKGYNTVVSEVKVGRVVDTIRSRRNALKEGYVFAPVIP